MFDTIRYFATALGITLVASFCTIPIAYADKDYFCTLTVMGECPEEDDDSIRIQNIDIYPASLKDNQTMQVDVILRNVLIYHFYDAYFVFQVSDDQNRTVYLYTQPKIDIGDGQAEYVSFNFTLNPGTYSTKLLVWEELRSGTYYPLLLHPNEQIMIIGNNTL